MNYPENTVLIVGHAKPGKDDAIYTVHGEFYISLVVEKATGIILDLACNTILDVTCRFAADLFVGKSLVRDLGEIEDSIRTRYFAFTQKPLIACLKDAANRYQMACCED